MTGPGQATDTALATEAAADQIAEMEQQFAELTRDMRRHRLRRLLRLAILVGLVIWFGSVWGVSWWLVPLLGAGAAELAARDARVKVTRGLGAARDPRAINLLARAAGIRDSDTRRMARAGLLDLLPTLRASHACHITNQGMAALCRLLGWKRHDHKLVLAILSAFEQVGDEQCITAVRGLLAPSRPARRLMRWLDDRFNAGLLRRIAVVTDAAHECLPYLERRAELRRQEAILLRPATAPVAVPEGQLLRPAQGPPTVGQEQLLRPADAPVRSDPAAGP